MRYLLLRLLGLILLIGNINNTAARLTSEEPVLYRGGVGRTGVYANSGLPTLQGMKWQKNLGVAPFAPIYADDVLYKGTYEGDLYALNAETGETIWKFPSVGNFVSAVAIADDTVYFGSGDKGLYAVNRTDGKLLWSFETDSAVWSATPLIVGDDLFVGSEKGVFYSINRQTHIQNWKVETGSPVYWEAVAEGENVYFPTKNTLYALNITTGEVVWKVKLSNSWMPLAASNGVIYAGTDGNQFKALNAATGEEMWSIKGDKPAGRDPAEWSAPIVTGDTIYVGHSSQNFYALDIKTGHQKWITPLADWGTAAPSLANGLIYFGVGAHGGNDDDNADRPFYALNAESGEIAWTFIGKGPVLDGMAVGDGAVYFNTVAGNLYALH